MSFTLATQLQCSYKAGAHANATLVADATIMGNFCDEAEGYIVCATRRNWVTDYASVTAIVKELLRDVCTSLVAMKCIVYNMSGFPSRRAAETALDLHNDIVYKGIEILKQDNLSKINAVV